MTFRKGDDRLPRRFWRKVHVMPNGCWLWKAATHDGYAKIWMYDTMVSAHRLAYDCLVDDIKPGLTFTHTCGVRHCVNPSHLAPNSFEENCQRKLTNDDVRRIRMLYTMGVSITAIRKMLDLKVGYRAVRLAAKNLTWRNL